MIIGFTCGSGGFTFYLHGNRQQAGRLVSALLAVNLHVFSEDKTKVLPEVVQRRVHLSRFCCETCVIRDLEGVRQTNGWT